MKIAFIIYNGMTALDFIGIYDPLSRLKTMNFMPDLEWDICAYTPEVKDNAGLDFTPTCVKPQLEGYDLLVVPGGLGTRELSGDTGFIEWLRSAEKVALKVSVCTGSLLLGSAGFLEGKKATTHFRSYDALRKYTSSVVEERIVDEGDVITAGGVTAGIDLGLYLVDKLAGSQVKEKIRKQMEYQQGLSTAPKNASLPDRRPQDKGADGGKRIAAVKRETRETQVEVSINLDGTGEHQIDTGIGFLDHMLTHLAVHGLFDLNVQARGDLNVDVHHTLEDVALTLGGAFREALGEKKGIERMAASYAPMDESLAFVAVDLSGRPYAVVEAEWTGSHISNIPLTLFPHFLESFASSAGCNLHARVLYGRDDHHKAEALFKALARALDAATRVDPRRAGLIPSTKGTLGG